MDSILRDAFLIGTSFATLLGLVFWWGWLLKNLEGRQATATENVTTAVNSLSFSEELKQMPPLLRFTIYLCLFFMTYVCMQCLFVLPVTS